MFSQGNTICFVKWCSWWFYQYSEETLNYSSDYTLNSIENAENCKEDFKPIKCNNDSFESFYTYEIDGTTYIELSFPIKQKYLESDNVIVLAIYAVTHIEKRVFFNN